MDEATVGGGGAAWHGAADGTGGGRRGGEPRRLGRSDGPADDPEAQRRESIHPVAGAYGSGGGWSGQRLRRRQRPPPDPEAVADGRAPRAVGPRGPRPRRVPVP